MNKTALLLLAAIVAFACNKQAPDKAHTRAMFDAGGLAVITSFANSKQQTMSLLYGNTAAKIYAVSGAPRHTPGEVFQLVVYKQADNKFWYGSHINGAVKSIETITSGKTTASANQLNYKLDYGETPHDSTDIKAEVAARLTFILSHRPSVFP
jgi:hypothetical protein